MMARVLWIIAGLGGLGVAASALLVPPERFMANWLLGFLFVLTVGLGCLFIVALEHLVHAKWSVPLRRVPERLSSLVLLVAPAALPLLFALPVLYPWARPEAAGVPLVAKKAVWLNGPFFSARVMLCFALWAVAYAVFVRSSERQDTSGDPAVTVRLRRFAPAFMVIFGLTVTLVAFDWISSMEPEWYSDIFGVYLFAGTFLAGLAATSLAALHQLARGRLQGVRSDHLYNLGGLIFAFTVFWSYIGFAQYLLMWYGNMPEEIFWYKDRIEGPWLVVALLLAIVHFLVPFFALIPRDAKSDPRRLRWVATVVLCAHYLDLYWLVFPSLGAAPWHSWPEASFVLLFGGVAVLWARRALERSADMPVGDPFFREGLEYRL